MEHHARFVIERALPGAGTLGHEDLRAISAKSHQVLSDVGGAQWVHGYVTDDAITCVHLADSADAVREHADCGGFPVTTVRRVRTLIAPTTGEPG